MRRRPPALLTAGAALLISLTSCSTADGGSVGSTLAAIGEQAPEPATAAEVVSAAAEEAKVAVGVKTDFAVRMRTSKQGVLRTRGRMSARSEPSLAFDQSFHEVSIAGKVLPGGMRTMLVGKVVYLKMDVLAAATGGKTWVRLPLSDLDSDSLDMDQLLRQGQSMDPVAHTHMITSSDDIKIVGKETLEGVRTTRYRGTFSVAEGLADLEPEIAAAMEESLAGLETMKFDLWLDDKWLTRKITMTGKVRDPALGTGTMSMVLRFRDYGEPVEIEKPPAGLTIDHTELPKLTGQA